MNCLFEIRVCRCKLTSCTFVHSKHGGRRCVSDALLPGCSSEASYDVYYLFQYLFQSHPRQFDISVHDLCHAHWCSDIVSVRAAVTEIGTHRTPNPVEFPGYARQLNAWGDCEQPTGLLHAPAFALRRLCADEFKAQLPLQRDLSSCYDGVEAEG